MIPDATFEPAPPQPKLRLRFSLLALLIFVTLVCLGLAWLVQPELVVATALFQVDTAAPTLLGDAALQPYDEQDYWNLQRTQIELLKSYFVMNAALRQPGIASLPYFAGRGDPVAWLQDRLEVEFPQNSEILVIRLRGPDAQANDLVQIVDAVAKAYRDEVIYEEKQRRLASRDLFARSLENLKKQTDRNYREYLDIAREAGRAESGSGQVLQEIDMKRLDRVETELLRLENEQLQAEAISDSKKVEAITQRIEQLRERQAELERKLTARAEKSVELTVRERELDQLQRIADEMSIKLEKTDIEANAPERIRQIQPAVISKE
ncbi:MAG: hypothetical protein WD738_22640 [Pirellulales bacterium]